MGLTSRSHEVERQATNRRLSPWIRVWLWALANADHHGHARAYRGDLRRHLNATSRDVSRAIDLARKHGVLDPCSNANCLVLPGHALAPCPALHRGDT